MKFNTAKFLPVLLLMWPCYALPNGPQQAENGQEKETDRRLDTLFGSHTAYHEFLDDLKAAAAANDSHKIAAMINYPIAANVDGKEITLESSHDFLINYEKIFSQRILGAIESQRYSNIFSKYDGIMIGNGEIWFAGICEDNSCTHEKIRITAINNGQAR